MKNLTYWIFGSKSSKDTDILVLVSSIPNIQESKKLVKKYESELQKNYSKPVNVNLGVLDKDHLSSVFKGTVGEVNNSIMDTYSNHKQKHSLKLKTRLARNIELKTIRCLRIILSFLSRTNYRVEIKKALKGDARDKYLLLNKINLAQFTNFKKNNVDQKDFLKTLAFQLGQTCALIEGDELYSKEAIAQKYPQLKKYLKREEDSLFPLEVFKQFFLNKLDPENLRGKKETLKS